MKHNKESSARVIELWTPVREKAYWSVLRILSDKGMTEDIIQEALITAIEKFHTLRDESKFESWFMTISIRKAYHYLSENKSYELSHAPELSDIDETYTADGSDYYPDEGYSSARYEEMMETILSSLQTDTKRFLFYLRYVEDRSINEISGITGLKEGTLKSIYSRIRKELGESLDRRQ